MTLTQFLSGKKAAIFDLDGTIVNNMRYHEQAFRNLATKHGITLTPEDFIWMMGRKNKEIFAKFFGEKSVEEHERLADEKEAIYRELFASEITEVPGLLIFLKMLSEHGMKLAIASAAPKENRIFVFKHLPIYEFFDSVVGAENVTYGKPHPEVFLTAAANLNVEPKDCIVFEDAPNGITAAKAAGMFVVGLLTTHTKEDLKEADMVIRDFRELITSE